jgi:hypothetical protein
MIGLVLLLFTFFGIIYFLGQIDLTYLEGESEKYWKTKKAQELYTDVTKSTS